MATTVTTSTASYATRGGRHTGVTSGGVDWVMHYDLFNTRFEFHYSTNDGGTWTEATSLRATVAANRAEQAEFYIGEHDRACFAHGGSGGHGLRYVPEITSTASWTTLNTSTQDTDFVRCKVLDYGNLAGTQTYAVVMMESNVGGELDLWTYQRRVSDDSAYSEQRVAFGTDSQVFDFDFQHNGDGKTAVDRPALYVVHRKFSSLNRTWFQRRAWNNTQRGWSTTQSLRVISSNGYALTDPLCGVFDGSRFIMAFTDDASDTLPKWYERDAGDTVTTARTVSALSDGGITSLSLTFDGNKDTRLYAVGTTSDDVKRITFDRSEATFGSWETIEATTATDRSASVQAGFQGDGINVVWTSGGSSPYDIEFERDPVNLAPLAATWETAGNATSIGSQYYSWNFQDPDDGDTQGAYALERTVNGGSAEYWNNGTQAWVGAEVKNSTSTTNAFDANGISDGDVLLVRVKTWDAGDEVGPWSSALSLFGSVEVNPTMTAPTLDEVIGTNSLTIEWTVSEQSAYRVRLLDSVSDIVYESGKITSSDTRSFDVPYVLPDGFEGTALVETWNSDDLVGLADTHTFTVDYVEPATATLVVAADNANGRVSITITDPTPTGSQPTVTSHDLFVRVASGGRTVGERSTATAGIRIIAATTDSTVYDYAAPSGVAFEYMVRARASSNGTSSDSAWTA